MRIFRLAQLLESKYSLQASAAQSVAPVDEQKIMETVVNDLLNVYRLYVTEDRRTNRNPGFANVAAHGEPQTSEIMMKINNMIKKIDKLSAKQIMDSLNEILGLIYKVRKPEGHRKIEDFLFDPKVWPTPLKSDRHDRDRNIKVCADQLKIIFRQFQQAGEKLQVIRPDTYVHGGTVSGKRQPLADVKYEEFGRSAAGQALGLDDPEIMDAIKQDPAVGPVLLTVMNALKRGHDPRDWEHVKGEVQQLKAWIAAHKAMQAGTGAIGEMSEEEYQGTKGLDIESPKTKSPVSPPVDPRLQEAIRQRDEAYRLKMEELHRHERQKELEEKQRQIEEDRERLIRSEGSARLQRIMKRYQ